MPTLLMSTMAIQYTYNQTFIGAQNLEFCAPSSQMQVKD